MKVYALKVCKNIIFLLRSILSNQKTVLLFSLLKAYKFKPDELDFFL